MRYYFRLLLSVLVAMSCATSAFGKAEDKSQSPLQTDESGSFDNLSHKETVKVIMPMIYGRSDGNIKEIFVETGADTVIIKEGHGGDVLEMFKTLDYLRVHPDKKVIIDGPCYSACTDLLAKNLKEGQVCFTHDAEFGFHSAHGEWPAGVKVTPKMRRDEEITTRKMNEQQFNLFDEPLKALLLERDAYASTELTEVKIEEMQALTHKGCGNGNPLAHL